VTADQLADWLARFRYYRRPPSEQDIRAWLDHFAAGDQAVAEKVLDHVTVVSEEEIQRGYRIALEAIPGWNRRRDRRRGEWVFAGFGGPGQSGSDMLRKFREANRLSADRFDYLFSAIGNLASLELTQQDTVVFVDDFSGTGDQVANLWPVHAELAGGARSFLILTAATQQAVERILTLDDLDELLVAQVLGTEANVFSEDNLQFTAAERAIILPYCVLSDPRNPTGFGSCGLLFVLSHKTPNNTLPILHANKATWRGLFPRYLNV
jgi:hypothetical protein